jgi:hypothetical protein
VKKFVLVVLAAALFLGIGIKNASADNSLKTGNVSLGITTGTDSLVYGKYMLANDLAIDGGLGFGIHTADDKRDTDINFEVGVRKYLKVADFAPFVGGVLSYDIANDGDEKTFGIFAVGGAEYFLAKHLSLEGTVGLGYSSTSYKAADKTAGLFGTKRAAIGFNFYF